MDNSFKSDSEILEEIEFQQSTISNNIRTRRKALKMTQEDLASKANLSLSTIQKVENNPLNPEIGTMIRIANALDIPLGLLYINPQRDKLYALDELLRFVQSADPISVEKFQPAEEDVSYIHKNSGRK